MMRLIVAALLCLNFIGCSNGIGDAVGLETRKSEIGSGTNRYNDNPDDIASVRLLTAVCSKIIECNNPGPNFCDADFMQTTTVDTEIGLTSGTYSNYSAVIAADFSGDILANTAALDSCVSEVRQLDCEHPSVVNGYNYGAPSPYANVAGMFTAACAGVF